MTERDIFIAALQKVDPAERRAYLERACAGQPEVLEQVEALLRLNEGAGSFLEQPAVDVPATGAFPEPAASTTGEVSGSMIGPYMLIEPVGEGGMGTVWMAQQTEPVKRLVAVKLIKAGMDSKQVIARFEAERQALALMDHPNIARVLDGGTTDAGRPYFVMDLVKGVPITKYCDEHHLTPRQRLELFVPVCQAVQHAHQKGIIHRDLKPSNVLVATYDDRPVPKVIDFGVAKATAQQLADEPLVTGYGAIVGTPEYMSPEQAEVNQLDVDTRSDIYSLGVVLYELLAGSPPFSREELEKAGMLEMLRVIREKEPSKPSTKLSSSDALPTLSANRGTEPAKLKKLVRGELDWIVMKALEKDRNRRYETANGFAMDIQRYLADEPVLAGPPSVWYRTRKFARRNRLQVALAASLAVLLLGATTFAWHSERQAARRRADAENRERDEQSRLAQNARAVAALLNQCEAALKASRADRAAVALEAAEHRAADGGAEQLAPRLSHCRADLELLRELDDVNKFRWTTAEGKLPGPAAQAARWRAALAAYGMKPDETSVAAAAARVGASPVRERILAALDLWLMQAPSAWARAVLQAADPDPTFRDLVRDARMKWDGKSLMSLLERPDALAQPARFAAALGELPDIPVGRRRALLESALHAAPGDLGLLMALGVSYPTLRAEGLAERLRWFQAAVAAHPENAAAHNNLAFALRDKWDADGAFAEVREAVRVDPSFAPARVNLALILRKKGDLAGAIAQLHEAIRLDPKLAAAHSNLGLALLDKGAVEEALKAFHEAIRVDPTYAVAHNNLAWLLAVGPDGVRDAEQAVAHAKRACELTDWVRPQCLDTLAAAYAAAGDFDRAVEFEKKALSFTAFERTDGKSSRDRLQLYVEKKPYRQAPREGK